MEEATEIETFDASRNETELCDGSSNCKQNVNCVGISKLKWNMHWKEQVESCLWYEVVNEMKSAIYIYFLNLPKWLWMIKKINKYCYNKQSASGINPIGVLTFNLFSHLSHEMCS